MDNGLVTSVKEVKEIKKEVVIGGGNDLDVFVDVLVDDELVVSKKSDSLLANFLRGLYLQMGAYRPTDTSVQVYRTNSSSIISAISSGVGGVIRLTLATTISSATSGKVTIGSTRGRVFDGRYDYNYIDGTHIDLVGTTYSAGYTASSGFAVMYIASNLTSYNTSYNCFNLLTDSIYVGLGTAAVSIDDCSLEKQVSTSSTYGLVYGTVSVSLDTNDSTSAQVQITRIFTNSSAYSVVVNELGIKGLLNSAYSAILLRDVLPSPITVTAGKVLTVNYRIKTTLETGTNPGGFVTNFMRLLYRHIAGTSRVAIDIDNTNNTTNPGSSDFRAFSNGGVNFPAGYVQKPGWQLGPVIGTGTGSVSMGDYYLGNAITHGTGSGQLLYAGSYVHNFQVAGDNASASFDIVKYAENASGGNVVANEIGLVVGGDGGTTQEGYSQGNDMPTKLYMVARNLITSPVTISNGTVLKITYTVKVVL